MSGPLKPKLDLGGPPSRRVADRTQVEVPRRLVNRIPLYRDANLAYAGSPSEFRPDDWLFLFVVPEDDDTMIQREFVRMQF